ncbi:septum formation protein Maf [Aquimarina sp. TRL1]|uniref:Maf-like protein n=1 Tax=Aquimarina sp. (strain TRL1) TaxID=2736252 RepID=UPI0015892C5C|nr:Maf-like protein [Aquimarina sp. TRL1]QKX06972.1 septum formation protein Maf [Aquimarina sp. TRL1]
MINELLKNHRIVLASGSPRRQQFFKDMGIDVHIDVKEVDEVYPDHLQGAAISDFLCELKSAAFEQLEPNDILITSDTIVWHNHKALGKPKNEEEAIKMIQSLSGKQHEVITSVCFKTTTASTTINHTTRVTFKDLSIAEITHYVKTYQPMDKAGAYGIQEWIGFIGITHIEGSFFTVMGLPTHLVYETLMSMVNS